MARFLKNQEKKKGLSPFESVFVGDIKLERPQIYLMDYTPDTLKERKIDVLSKLIPYRDNSSVTWINIDGLHDVELMDDVSEAFGIHPLVMEDILNTGQRPKAEESNGLLFVVCKMLTYQSESKEIISEQLSIVVGDKFLLTFQERPGDIFDGVRERIRSQKGRIRHAGADYLAYALLDSIVDNYIYVISRLGDRIEDLEYKVLENTSEKTLKKINHFKREMCFIRKCVHPFRDFNLRLPRLETNIINPDNKPFFRDLLDLSIQANDAVDIYREMLSDQLNVYNSMIGNRMNDIMRVLTIFASIFIPLTFIAGIYGVNFEYVPEFHYKYSYFIFWAVLISIVTVMLYFFKRKGWL